jgi:ribonuclease T1
MVRSLNRLWLALTLLLMLTAGSAAAFDPRGIGITDTDSFAETVAALRQTGRLPPRYLTKREAEEAGWKPGGDLCRAAPGRTIGGAGSKPISSRAAASAAPSAWCGRATG